jgi:hypothetical protein
MTTSLMLRIAAAITLLYFTGHTLGSPWIPAAGPLEASVVEAMKTHQFEALGSSRTYWDFYYGFGWAISGFLLLQAVVLWQLAGLARTSPPTLRPIIAAFLASFALNAFVAWKFFFAVPAAMAVAIAACLAIAFAIASVQTKQLTDATGGM